EDFWQVSSKKLASAPCRRSAALRAGSPSGGGWAICPSLIGGLNFPVEPFAFTGERFMTKLPDPAADGAQMSFDGRMSYGDYLAIDQILTAQKPLSSAHDEMLFIIQHQTSELWMRLALHELDAARRCVAEDRAREAFKMLSRIARIFEQLN